MMLVLTSHLLRLFAPLQFFFFKVCIFIFFSFFFSVCFIFCNVLSMDSRRKTDDAASSSESFSDVPLSNYSLTQSCGFLQQDDYDISVVFL